MRWQARGTAFEQAQVPQLRDFPPKIAVWVKATVRQVVLHLPLGHRRKRSGCRLPAGWEG